MVLFQIIDKNALNLSTSSELWFNSHNRNIKRETKPLTRHKLWQHLLETSVVGHVIARLGSQYTCTRHLTPALCYVHTTAEKPDRGHPETRKNVLRTRDLQSTKQTLVRATLPNVCITRKLLKQENQAQRQLARYYRDSKVVHHQHHMQYDCKRAAYCTGLSGVTIANNNQTYLFRHRNHIP